MHISLNNALAIDGYGKEYFLVMVSSILPFLLFFRTENQTIRKSVKFNHKRQTSSRHQTMMAAENTDECSKKFNIFGTHNDNDEKFAIGDDCAEYGLPLKEVYKLAYNFYKGKNYC